MNSKGTANSTIIMMILVLAAAIFAWDCSIELGVAGGVPYVAIVLLSIRMVDKRWVLLAAVACSLLTVLGFFLSPQGGELWKVLLNRGLALFAIWVTAILGLGWRNKEEQIHEQAKQIERQKGEQDFRLAVEAAPNGMLMTDKDGRIVLLNAELERMCGYDRRELMGQFVELLVPEAARQLHASLRADFMQRPTPRPMGTGRELFAQTKDGRVFPVEIGLNPISNSAGKFILASIVDITVRKKVERVLETDVQMRVAHAIQERFFPTSAPFLPEFEIAGGVHPAQETSGDYYDFIRMKDGKLAVVIADVSGHGFGPALLMANTRAYLRTLARVFTDIGDIITSANHMLSLDTKGHGFVTLFLAELDPKQRAFRYAAAGHQAYHFTAHGRVNELPAEHPPLGIIQDTEIPCSSPTSMNQGELLVMMTDGIAETKSSDGAMFGIQRALDVVRNHRDQSAHAIVDALYRESRAFAGDIKQLDDITTIVVKT